LVNGDTIYSLKKTESEEHTNLIMCTSNEQSENETNKTISITIASKRIKLLEVTLTKKVNKLYIKNDIIVLKLK
jgi:hypothetical protein